MMISTVRSMPQRENRTQSPLSVKSSSLYKLSASFRKSYKQRNRFSILLTTLPSNLQYTSPLVGVAIRDNRQNNIDNNIMFNNMFKFCSSSHETVWWKDTSQKIESLKNILVLVSLLFWGLSFGFIL